MVAVSAFANANVGRVPAVFSDVKPSADLLREDLIVTPAGMLWKIGPRSEGGIDLKYWDYPVQPESIPRKGRRARGHWGYVSAEGTEMKPELYEDRFFLPLLWAKVRLADLYLPQEPAKSLSIYESVLAAYPEATQDPRFAYHRGLALYTTGRRGEAARAWEELLTAKPPQEIEVFVQFYMGELHREAGHPAEAVRHYRQSQAANPPPELQKALQERLQGR
jgi:tetratricopeptide (TPR) repeat protein